MKYIVVLGIIIASAILFQKASGTLKPNLINIVSFIFYNIMLFQVIGGTIVYFGFNDHYLLEKLSNKSMINAGYYSILYTIIIMPLIIIISNLIFFKMSPKNVRINYIKKIKDNIELREDGFEDKVCVIIRILSCVSLVSIIYVFYKIGYIPILKLLDSSFDYNVQRIIISRKFSGNIYIKNILMLLMTPMLSYISYIYMRATKQPKWRRNFIFTSILSILAVTYNFEKAAIIYYVFYFFLIEIILGRTFNLKKMVKYIIGCVLLIVLLSSVIMGYNGKLLSLSSGPISRIIMTPTATLMLHYDCFGKSVDFLKGGSFPKIFSILFDANQYGIRSAQIVMEIYGAAAIKRGTAGVMNTLFIGEAYANFGKAGVIILPIIISIIFSTVFCLFIKSKKTPLNIVLYLELFTILTGIIQGGMIDYFYNIKIIAVILIIFFIKALASTSNFMYRYNKERRKE